MTNVRAAAAEELRNDLRNFEESVRLHAQAQADRFHEKWGMPVVGISIDVRRLGSVGDPHARALVESVDVTFEV